MKKTMTIGEIARRAESGEPLPPEIMKAISRNSLAKQEAEKKAAALAAALAAPDFIWRKPAGFRR